MTLKERKPVLSRQEISRFVCGCLSLLLACNLASAQASSGAGTEGAASPVLKRRQVVTISPGDTLDITVFDAPELTTKVHVQTNGDIVLPLIGSIHAADRGVEETAASIREALVGGGYMRDPQVSVFLEISLAQTISVLGAVARPGSIPIAGSKKLFGALADAGGLLPLAGGTITINRPGEAPVAIEIEGDLASKEELDVPVYAGDTIMVSHASVIYVVGKVTKPGEYSSENLGPLSVARALALAGGTVRFANDRKIVVVRKGEDGARSSFVVNGKAILEAKAPDFPLHDQDIVYVPTDQTSFILTTAATAAVSAVVGIVVYRERN